MHHKTDGSKSKFSYAQTAVIKKGFEESLKIYFNKDSVMEDHEMFEYKSRHQIKSLLSTCSSKLKVNFQRKGKI